MIAQNKVKLNKKEIESKMLELDKLKIEAIKVQNYAYAAIIRDQERDLRESLRNL